MIADLLKVPLVQNMYIYNMNGTQAMAETETRCRVHIDDKQGRAETLNSQEAPRGCFYKMQNGSLDARCDALRSSTK